MEARNIIPISKNNKFDQIFTKLIDHFIVRLDYLIQKRTDKYSHLVSKLEKILLDTQQGPEVTR